MRSSLSTWVRLHLVLAACLVAVRLLFFVELHFRIGEAWSSFPLVMSGLLFDGMLLCRVFVYGLIPFVLLHRFLPKLAMGLFWSLLILYVVVSALLTEYYCHLRMPLDHVILVYTPEELRETVSSSTSLTGAPVIGFLLHLAVPASLICLFRRWQRRGPRPLSPFVLVPIVAATLLLVVFGNYGNTIRKERFYDTHSAFCLAVNQPSYSWIKIMDYINESAQDSEAGYGKTVSEAEASYHAAHPEFTYDHPGYPFYRVANDPDVLGPFFRPTSDGVLPNLVIVVVEGLGRRLTGVVDPVLSFTPFIDSLAATGLFWPNCFSTSERTFGVLPSVFASVPHGRLGFANSLSYLPRHHSLLLDLKKNGYRTAFYYGGEPSFDRYDVFMEENQVDYLFVPDLSVDDSAQYQLLADNNRWGLDDGQLFDAAVKHKEADTTTGEPFADIFLTLTTHEPFRIEGIERYEQQVKEQVEQASNLSAKERDNVMANLNIYACYLYMDQCVRELYAYYASRDDFDRTIVVITGDHRMAYMPFGIPLRKYNVPLVLSSPLITRPKTMNAVVSHLDITPSLNAFLHANYDYAIDGHCHWLGTSFDTVAEFRNTRKLAFMLNNRDVVDYVSGDYFINHKTLVRFDERMTGTILEDEQQFLRLKEELDDFQFLSRFAVQHDFILPGDADERP